MLHHLYAILRYAESLREFTEIKQVSARSILVCREFTDIKQVSARSIQVCRGSMLGTLLLRVEHPYIVRKSENSQDMGELTFHAEKTAC